MQTREATRREATRDEATRDSRVLRPLSDLAFFSQCFIEVGALAWVNYFALREQSLHERLRAAGALRRHADAA